MAASETRFSPFRDIGTRRRCPPYTGERPKRHGHARHAHRSTLSRVVAGYHPLLEPRVRATPTFDAQAERPRRVWVGLPSG